MSDLRQINEPSGYMSKERTKGFDSPPMFSEYSGYAKSKIPLKNDKKDALI